MANTTPDFVQVQLTAEAQQFAGLHLLTISNGRRSFTFIGGNPQKVELSYEWRLWLSRKTLRDGSPMFAIVPTPPPVQGTQTSAPPSAADAQTPTVEKAA